MAFSQIISTVLANLTRKSLRMIILFLVKVIHQIILKDYRDSRRQRCTAKDFIMRISSECTLFNLSMINVYNEKSFLRS